MRIFAFCAFCVCIYMFCICIKRLCVVVGCEQIKVPYFHSITKQAAFCVWHLLQLWIYRTPLSRRGGWRQTDAVYLPTFPFTALVKHWFYYGKKFLAWRAWWWFFRRCECLLPPTPNQQRARTDITGRFMPAALPLLPVYGLHPASPCCTRTLRSPGTPCAALLRAASSPRLQVSYSLSLCWAWHCYGASINNLDILAFSHLHQLPPACWLPSFYTPLRLLALFNVYSGITTGSSLPCAFEPSLHAAHTTHARFPTVYKQHYTIVVYWDKDKNL